MRITDEQLRGLADDAFVVLNWARRLGFDRERQQAEVVKAFEVRLGYRKTRRAELVSALDGIGYDMLAGVDPKWREMLTDQQLADAAEAFGVEVAS